MHELSFALRRRSEVLWAMRKPIIRRRYGGRIVKDVPVSEMLFTASGKFAFLRAVWSQYGSEIWIIRFRHADISSTPSRADLSPLWWSVSSEHSFLRKMRSEYGLVFVTDKFLSSAYNVSNQTRSHTKTNR